MSRSRVGAVCNWLLCLTAVFWLSPLWAEPVENLPLPQDIQRILQRGALVVALPAVDTPPFFYQENGVLLGTDVDLARGLAKSLNVGVRFNRSAKSFDGVLDVVARGDADVGISKLSRTMARAMKVLYSEPYLTLKHAMALNRVCFARLSKGRDIQAVLRSFNGTVGILAHTSYANFARQNFPKAKIVEFKEWATLVTALKQGEIDAAYRDQLEIQRLFLDDPHSAIVLRSVTFTDTRDSLGMIVAADAHHLLSAVNLYLAEQPQKLNAETILKHAGGVKP